MRKLTFYENLKIQRARKRASELCDVLARDRGDWSVEGYQMVIKWSDREIREVLMYLVALEIQTLDIPLNSEVRNANREILMVVSVIGDLKRAGWIRRGGA